MFRTTQELIPNRIRRLQAREQPYATILKVDGDGDGDGDVQHLTLRGLEVASNKAAWFLDENVQEEKFFYMGPSDIRYVVWVLAAMKTRKCVVFPSPTNTISANIGLFGRVGARTLLYAPEALDTLSPLLAATAEMAKPVESPTYTGLLLSDETVDAYPFDVTFDQISETPFLGLHTSGTSGHPKPVYWNYNALTTLPSMLDPKVHDEAAYGPSSLALLFRERVICNPFPLFHFGGLAAMLTSLYFENTVVLPYPGTRLTPTNVTALIKLGKCQAAFLPPTVLEALVEYPQALETLSQLNAVSYAGAALNPSRGKELIKHIRNLFPTIASTEGGPSHLIFSGDNMNWNAYQFLDVGQRMEEVAPGFFELVFPRTDLTERSNAYFHTLARQDNEYRTADLFSPVEGRPGAWVYRGRADNWMTLSTGLKMDPTDMENIINAHPEVLGSIVTGSYRVRPCLLVELKQPPVDETSRAGALDSLWPTIKKANEGMPKLGRIPRELVIFSTESKPFLRASKGTVQRVLTVSAYADEIDEAYAGAEESLLTGGLPPLESTEAAGLSPLLTVLFSDVMHKTDDGLGADDELFTRGLDSLGVSVILARLKATLRNRGIPDEKLGAIKSQLVYKETTISRLAGAISAILSGTGRSEEHEADQKSLNQVLETYEKKVHALLQGSKPRPLGVDRTGHTVVLTGSTGSVGSYILASLLSRNDVKKVFCLNRGEDAQTKQGASFRARGLPNLEAEGSRVVFLRTTLQSPLLGLSHSDYTTVAREATAIVHNAYPVNFLLSLPAFEPQIQALINLLELGIRGNQNPSVLFVSSIAAATPVLGQAQQGEIPEEVINSEEAKGILSQGYAQSKYICERLLQSYSSLSEGDRDTKTAVLRVGQVCGPVTGPGTWNASEWAPSLVISSKFLGARPQSIGNLEVNWVPVDKLGDIVTELMIATSTLNASSVPFTVYNVVNRHTTPWGDLVAALERIAPEVVSAEEWIRRLEDSDKGRLMTNQNPASKLLDFYKQTMLTNTPSNVTTAVGNLLRRSETAKTVPRIERGHLERWMAGWGL
ncbi:hypothetical protein GGS20DRAFT_575231 [Poronia punctata]|nr:hypothetical protein GGS20DRAFT_575231 [Poronia punctata]